MRRGRPALLAVLSSSLALATPAAPYAWKHSSSQDPLATRFAPPAGAERVPATGFGAWLRGLPLLPAGTAVHLFDGREKPRQDVHAAVIDIDVGKRDLQQCADAVMRLRAEYLYARGEAIAFHPDPGRPRALAFPANAHATPGRAAFERFLVRLFADAGSASLQAELRPVGARAVEPGDVLIQGGYPGHAVIVLDVAAAPDGHRYLLLAQSYMPAQQLHVVRNLGAAALSPWYDERDLDGPGLATPEWRPFTRKDLRRF